MHHSHQPYHPEHLQQLDFNHFSVNMLKRAGLSNISNEIPVRVADIGCGVGCMVPFFAKHISHQHSALFCVEPREADMEPLDKKIKNSVRIEDLQKVQIDELVDVHMIPHGSLDFIFIRAVMCYLPNKVPETLRKLLLLLKPQTGVLCVQDYNTDSRRIYPVAPEFDDYFRALQEALHDETVDNLGAKLPNIVMTQLSDVAELVEFLPNLVTGRIPDSPIADQYYEYLVTKAKKMIEPEVYRRVLKKWSEATMTKDHIIFSHMLCDCVIRRK